MNNLINSQGQLVFLVGNSGSGKDSLLKEAIKNWPPFASPIKIPRRFITRSPHDSEPFHSLSKQEFIELKQKNFFCLTWHIYGLDYGISNEIDDWLKYGDIVIINVSRSIIAQAKNKYPDLKVVFIKVPFEVTLNRIKQRGRESEDDPIFKARLERAKINQDIPDADFIIENTNSIQTGGLKLRDYLLQFSK